MKLFFFVPSWDCERLLRSPYLWLALPFLPFPCSCLLAGRFLGGGFLFPVNPGWPGLPLGSGCALGLCRAARRVRPLRPSTGRLPATRFSGLAINPALAFVAREPLTKTFLRHYFFLLDLADLFPQLAAPTLRHFTSAPEAYADGQTL